MPDFVQIELFLKIVLALIMLSVGLSLTSADFRYIFQNTRIFLVALVSKMLLFPLMGMLVAHAFGLPPMFQVGIFLLLICPGGTTSNVITYWFSGTTALTISLTVITSFLAVFLIPPLVNWSHHFYLGDGVQVNLPVFDTTTNIFIIVILPVLAGMVYRMYRPKPAIVAERIIKNVSVGLLGIIYLVKFFASKQHGGAELHQNEIMTLLPVLLLINVLAMVLGFLVPKIFRIGNRDSMTIGIELGLQNVSLALLVGSVLLRNEELVKPALIYAMFSFWTATLFGLIVNKKYYEKKWV